MSTGDVASRGRAALILVLGDSVAEAHEADERVSAILVRTRTSRSVHVRVSTKTAGTWQSNKGLRDGRAVRDPSRLWAFITIGKESVPATPVAFLAYEADVRRDMDADIQQWYERRIDSDPRVKNVGHTAITEKRVHLLAQPVAELLK